MSRSLWFVLGFSVIAAAAPARGQGLLEAIGDAIADSMDEGGGYDHDHDHYHPNNNGYNNNGYNNNGYYRPPYPNSQPQRIWNGSYWEYVTPAPSVVYPGTTVVAPSQVVTASPVVQNALPYKGPGVTITLEQEEGGSVNYVVDGKETATIQAGQQQSLTAKGKYEVRFSRGTSPDGRNFGEARYTITEGDYHFKVTDKGWELLRDKEQPRLVAAQAQASASGIKTSTLPAKNVVPAAPAAAQPAAPAAAAPPADPGAPAPNTLPAAKAAAAVPAPPAAPAAGG